VYVDYVRQFAFDFAALYTAAHKRMERLRRGQQMWQLLHARMSGFIVDTLVRRVQGNPLPLVDAKAQRDFVALTQIPPSRLLDLWPAPARADYLLQSSDSHMLQAELANDYQELAAIFRAYSRALEAGSASTTTTGSRNSASSFDVPTVRKGSASDWSGCLLMSSRDYAEWTRDLKIVSRTALKQAAVDEVFRACITPVGSGESGKVQSRLALGPSQFAEALVRLALLRYPGLSCLSDSVALFLRRDVLKRSRKVQPDLLRCRFQSTDYLELLRKHRRKLRKVFLTHASSGGGSAGGSGSGGSGSTSSGAASSYVDRYSLEGKDLLQLLRLAKLIGGGEGVSVEDLYTVISNIKRGDYLTYDNSAAEPETARLDYGEFCQAMVGVALYKNPDPFTPIWQRVDHFLTRDFMPSIK